MPAPANLYPLTPNGKGFRVVASPAPAPESAALLLACAPTMRFQSISPDAVDRLDQVNGWQLFFMDASSTTSKTQLASLVLSISKAASNPRFAREASALIRPPTASGGVCLFTPMYAVDQTYLAEPSALTSRDGDWLRQGLIVAKRGIKSLHCDIEVRVLVLQDNAELLFVGTVIDRDDTSCSLRLWGGGELLIQLSSVRRVGVVGSHSQRERADVIRRQRAGQPARVYGECKPPPSVELSDEMYERVQEFAAARGLSVEQATAKLIDVAAGRLAALRKYAEKSSRLTCGAR